MSTAEFLPFPTIPSGIVSDGIIVGLNNATINATDTFTVNSTDTVINDPVVELNKNETGAGITSSPPEGGFTVNRGTLTDFKVVYNELLSSATYGTDIQRYIGGVGQSISDGILKWDTVTKSFLNLAGTEPLSIGNLTCNGTFTIGGVTQTWPTNTPTAGYVLSNDGANNLSWVVQTGGGGGVSGDEIKNTGDTTSVETERGGFSDNIFLRANSVDVAQITSTLTTINNNLKINGGFTVNSIMTNVVNYTVVDSDCIVNWNGANDGTIIIPLANSNPGRILTIQNLSTSRSVTLVRSGSDTFDGETVFRAMESKYDHVDLRSDGYSNWMIL